jgi:hypothetical protein
MWIATKHGFYSAVAKGGEANVCVRARVKQDLENLRQFHRLPFEIIENAGTDYPYRANFSKYAWANILSSLAEDIDYSNFKNEVYERQGSERAAIYGTVWSTLVKLEWLPLKEQADVAKVKATR